ncbi:uncharacterized protein LOC125045124 [Penaeus chinensis]|uniref:uncharacterized protein LOC125045124 n=1 Tax=Penaeus chinensis TaxID=139456 RepID=UPI001FB5D409|nr:uncharacterized protein LOC125045124 [Penaeus chinensis]
MTSNSSRRNLRLSPNELDNLLREEKKKWQIFRLQQVREQAKLEAQRVRKAVVREKVHIEDGLKQELLAKYLDNKNATEKKLQEEYLMCLQAFGEAHRGAKNEPDPSKVLADRAQYNNIKANRRGREAAKLEAEEQAHRNREKNRPIHQRQDALQLEKARAQRVAQLPIPEAFRKKKPIIQEKVSKVKLYEAGTYTTTTYVPKNTVVEKEIESTHPSAHEMARKEAEDLAAKAEAELQEAEEEAQKREQRGKEALARERLNRKYIELMEKLQQAQQDHQLSSYMRGADLTIYEVERSRLGGLTSLERHMERVVEGMLRDEAGQARESKVPAQKLVESSDLVEVLESSKQDLSYDSKLQDLQEILEKIREQRQHLLETTVVSSPEDLPAGEQYEPDESEGYDPGDSDEDVEDPRVISGKGRTETQSQRLRTSSTEGGEDEANLGQERCPYGRTSAERQGLPSAETLPSSIPLHYPSGGVGRRSIEDTYQTSYEPSSALESSSGDIEVKIRISDDSSFETDRPTMPVISNLPGKYQEKSSSIGDEASTEYLSPPSHLPSKGYNYEDTVENLRRITEHRQKIASLLDTLPVKSHQRTSNFSTPTSMYTEKLKGEGSGQRPLKKKQKFELKKKEIIQHYINELLKMRGDDLLQISASTVEGSGLTISCMSAFLEAMEKTGDDSTLSSSYLSLKHRSPSLPQNSSTSNYEDIDEIPVRLSSCSSIDKRDAQDHSPTTYSSHCSKVSYEPQRYHNIPSFPISQISGDSKTKRISEDYLTNMDYKHYTDPRHTKIDMLDGNSDQRGFSPEFIDRSNSTGKEKYDTGGSVWNTFRRTSQHIGTDPPCDDQSTDSVTLDDGNAYGTQSRNYEKELEILEKLSTLQKLKQDILQAQSTFVKEESELYVSQEAESRMPQSSDPAESAATETSHCSSQKYSRKVTFGETQLKKDLSIIYEDSSFMSDYVNKSKSLSYQTPSREYESSPEDHRVTRLPARSDSSHLEYTASPYDLQPRHKSYTSLTEQGSESSRDSQLDSKSMQRSRVGGHMSQSPFQFSAPNSHSFNAEGMNAKRFINSGSTVLPPSNRNERQSSFSEEPEQNLSTLDHTTSSSVFTPLGPETTLTSTSAFLLPLNDSSNQREDQASIKKVADDSTETETSGQSQGLSRKGSSDSVYSMPDMTEVLKKFGLDWAESMMKKMEKSEKRSSSENSFCD